MIEIIEGFEINKNDKSNRIINIDISDEILKLDGLLKSGVITKEEFEQAKKKLLKEKEIKISAQAYLEKFYLDIGFEFKGERYMEDGIPHCAMYYNKKTN